jgi:hypothetical protein
MIDVPMKFELDERHLMIGGNAKIIVSNPKTLTGTTTHQGAWEVAVSNWHDVD